MPEIIAAASHFNILDAASTAAVDSLSNAVSVLSALVSVQSAQISVLSQQVSVVSNNASVALARTNVISAGLGLLQKKVVTGVQGVSATAGIKVSGLSVSCLANSVYQLEGALLYSTSGTANAYKFGMSVSALTLGAIAGTWECMISVANNTSAPGGAVGGLTRGMFNAIALAQISTLPGTTGIVAIGQLRAIVVTSTTPGTLRIKAAVSAAASPINIMKGSYIRAFQIA